MWFQQPPEPTHDPEQVRELADEILSRSEYQEASESQSLLDEILEAIRDLLDNLFGGGSDTSTGGGNAPDVISWVLLAILVAVIAGLVAWAVRSGGWRRTRAATEEPVILDAEERRSAADWRSEAERHEAAGRWREGLLCRYRALVTELVRAKVVSDQPGRTAGEYLRDVSASRPGAAASFAAATELFEAAWYGGLETGATERDRFASLAADTLARLDRPERREPVAAS